MDNLLRYNQLIEEIKELDSVNLSLDNIYYEYEYSKKFEIRLKDFQKAMGKLRRSKEVEALILYTKVKDLSNK